MKPATSLLAHLAELLSSGQQLPELMDRLVFMLADWAETDRLAIYLLDEDGETSDTPAAASVTWNNQQSDDLSLQGQTLLTFPVFNAQNKLLGHLAVVISENLSAQGTAEFRANFAAVCPLVAAVIEHAQLYQSYMRKNIELVKTKKKLLQRMEELQCLLDFEKIAAAALTEEELYAALLAATSKIMEANGISLALTTKDCEIVECTVYSAETPGDLRSFVFRSDFGFIGYCLKFRKARCSLISHMDTPNGVLFSEVFSLRTGSVLALPVANEGQLLGAIEVVRSTECSKPFAEGDELTMGVIANQFGKIIALRRARERKQKADNLAAIGKMLSSMLHDLRTPMSLVSGLFLLTVAEENEQERQKNYRQAQQQLQHINVMMEDTLAFARGQRALHLRLTEIAPFCNHLMQDIASFLRPHDNIAFHAEVQVVGSTELDAEKLRRVVLNLARNALEAITGKGEISIAASTDSSSLHIKVHDTGKGMSRAEQQKIFESFYSAGKKGGTGLGLAIAKDIIAAHGGSIEVTSELGKGTTMAICLPLSSQSTSM